MWKRAGPSLHTHTLRIENGHVPKKLAADRGWSDHRGAFVWEGKKSRVGQKGCLGRSPRLFLVGGGCRGDSTYM